MADYSQPEQVGAGSQRASIVNRMIHNKLRISAHMALRLATYFGTSAQSTW